MNLTAGIVVDILELGLSGFAFLMVYLTFRLLKNEQSRETIRKPMLRAAYFFMLGTFTFSILVSASAIFELADEAQTAAHRADIAQCRDGLTRLSSIAQIREQRVEDLQIAIQRFEGQCTSTLAALDDAN
jgi:hypothetical protein